MTDITLIIVITGISVLNLMTWLVVLGRLRLILDFIKEEKEGEK